MRELLSVYRLVRPLSAGTLGQYAIAARNWDSLTKVRLRQVSTDLVAQFSCDLLASGMAPATVRSRMGAVRTLLTFAIEHGWVRPIGKWPKVRVPRREPTALPMEQFNRLLAACLAWRRPVNGRRATQDWSPQHMLALAVTIYETGERIDALIRVPRQNVDVLRRTLFVPAELRKGKHADKVHMISERLLSLLMALPESERLFDWRGKLQTLRWHWKKILKLAGLPVTRRHLFHCLRRTHATHATAVAGIDAARSAHRPKPQRRRS